MTEFLKKPRFYGADTAIGVMSVLGAVGLLLVVRRHDASVVPLVALGWTLYLVQEHLVHRFVFHALAPRTQYLFDALYRLHYGHHDQIQRKNLLFTPWWFAFPLAVLNVAGFWLALPLRDALVAVLGGGVPAYLLFEWLHLTSHIRPASRGRLGRYIAERQVLAPLAVDRAASPPRSRGNEGSRLTVHLGDERERRGGLRHARVRQPWKTGPQPRRLRLVRDEVWSTATVPVHRL